MVKGKCEFAVETFSHDTQFIKSWVPAALLSRESLGIITGSFSSKSLSDLDSSSDHGFRFFTFFALDFVDDGVLLTLAPAKSKVKKIFSRLLIVYKFSINFDLKKFSFKHCKFSSLP